MTLQRQDSPRGGGSDPRRVPGPLALGCCGQQLSLVPTLPLTLPSLSYPAVGGGRAPAELAATAQSRLFPLLGKATLHEDTQQLRRAGLTVHVRSEDRKRKEADRLWSWSSPAHAAGPGGLGARGRSLEPCPHESACQDSRAGPIWLGLSGNPTPSQRWEVDGRNTGEARAVPKAVRGTHVARGPEARLLPGPLPAAARGPQEPGQVGSGPG